jgi:hypothetical protein
MHAGALGGCSGGASESSGRFAARLPSRREAGRCWAITWKGKLAAVAIEATTGWRWVARAAGSRVRGASGRSGSGERAAGSSPTPENRPPRRALAGAAARPRRSPRPGCRRPRASVFATGHGCARARRERAAPARPRRPALSGAGDDLRRRPDPRLPPARRHRRRPPLPATTAAGTRERLDPSVIESADSKRLGRLAKQGSRHLPWALVEAANHSHRHSSPDHDLYQRTVRRCGRGRARLTIARKIADRSYHLLLGRTSLYQRASTLTCPPPLRLRLFRKALERVHGSARRARPEASTCPQRARRARRRTASPRPTARRGSSGGEASGSAR